MVTKAKRLILDRPTLEDAAEGIEIRGREDGVGHVEVLQMAKVRTSTIGRQLVSVFAGIPVTTEGQTGG